jgi:SAM-dependent methyltransferase
MTKRPNRFSPEDSRATDDAEAGCREHFVDADLYDYDYRHRRADINFYRQLAGDRMAFAKGPVLDLACGSGRLLIPLLRDGHDVIGLDRSEFMLAAAVKRVRRLGRCRRQRCVLVRADLRSFAFRTEATLTVAAFHSVQHLLTDDDFLRFLAAARASLVKGGWLAFDVLPPDPAWLGRDPDRRWGRTTFRHPTTRQTYVYTTNHRYDPQSKLLFMRLYYQPVDGQGRPCGQEHTVRLCHRQYTPDEVTEMLKRAGFRRIALFAGFDGRLLEDTPDGADEHVYVSVAV